MPGGMASGLGAPDNVTCYVGCWWSRCWAVRNRFDIDKGFPSLSSLQTTSLLARAEDYYLHVCTYRKMYG